MDCFVEHNQEMMLPSSVAHDTYKGFENRQSQCQELIEMNNQIMQDNPANNTNNYTILPAVNLCPITWGIGNLEVADTAQSGFVEVCHIVNNSVASSTGRVRRKPRPYSPSDLTVESKKSKQKRKATKVQKINSSNDVYIDKRTGLPFACDKCKSPHIVAPTRCNPENRKRPPMPRKYVDPINGRIMLLCNACGIAAKTNRKARTEKKNVDADTLQRLKDQYITESMTFARKLSYEYNEPEIAMLYCPSFTTKGCSCIEKYLSSGTNVVANERQQKVLDLLSYRRRAGELNKNQNYINADENDYCTVNSENELHIDECEDNFIEGLRKPHYRCKSREFEKFVLTSRMKLRSEYGLCEKATQKILMYSNNFLHKESKTCPQRGPRIDKIIKKTARLKPILDMHKEYCCGNGCTQIASSHANLLENWRKRASLSQKDARRVIAEMLTPTGGTKANCYRFIKMVTGCCVTTIFMVNEHMKKTKGDREPPEHGLKKYWRRNSKSHKVSMKSLGGNTTSGKSLSSNFLPSEEELLSMETDAAYSLLESKKQQLECLQNKLQRVESKLKSVIELGVTQELQTQENLVNEFNQGVTTNLFILGQDGVIRPWKNDTSYEQITTQDNT